MRPFILSPLFSSVDGLPFVGDRTAKKLQKFGKIKVLDLLFSFPNQVERRVFCENLSSVFSKALVSCEVTVVEHLPPLRPPQPYRVLCHQNGTPLSLVFFHGQRPYLLNALPVGEHRLVSGVLDRTATGLQIVHPDYVGSLSAKSEWEGCAPLYSLTAGVSQTIYRKIMKGALCRLPNLPEWLPLPLVQQEGWPSWKEAMMAVHHPQNENDVLPASKARERLAFDEFLAYQLGLTLFREKSLKKTGQAFKNSGTLVSRVRAGLPFQLTADQERVLVTLFEDLQATVPMMRLLQGDVGSGKTIVALLAMLQVVDSGGQCALLAPTEILAHQHYETLSSFLVGTSLKVGLFTGRVPKKEKSELKQKLEQGDIHIAIGTHALLEEDVVFQQLGFVVIDEQHRFGVEQRQRLMNKGQGVNVLVMSATPIPQSLALTLYGDLDISLLKEKPSGRLPIQTKVLPLERLSDVHQALKRVVEEGQKVYWVCPLIEESEALDLGHTEARLAVLKELLGPDQVTLLHGRMEGSEKEEAILSFKEGRSAVLVSTTVIEVGVHIPDATIMIIEHAERFGLAQLHQLRGRVGRGAQPSSCLLLYGKQLSATGKKRLEIMRSTEDGFLIAEEDLKLRGAGDLLGTKQSGVPDFHIAALETQGHLLEKAYFLARTLVAQKDNILEDPSLGILMGLFQRRS